MLERSSPYRSWVLRCWIEQGYTVGQVSYWRFSLEDPSTTTRCAFASLAALIAYVQIELAEDAIARDHGV